MSPAIRATVTIAIFATMLVLVVVRPRRWNEAWWTMLGAAAMLVLRLVSPGEALGATLAGKSALLFLLSLLALSLLVGKSGFFDWAAIHCARIAKGDARSLFRNTFVLGAIVTAILSLDTTAVILTPIVLALVKRLKLPAVPYIVMCAFVASVGSLLLPISNLTNLLFADTFHLTFTAFAARMAAPQLVALATTYALMRWSFRRELPERFEHDDLPEPASAVPSRAYFLISAAMLGVVLIGYFLAPFAGVEPYVVAFGASGVLAIAGLLTRRVRTSAAYELSWSVFPFVIGLFVAVQGLENLGIVGTASGWLTSMEPGSPAKLLFTSGVTAFTANLMNNLPTALIARSVLSTSHAHTGTILAALIGANAGAMITPFGSLATMLVLTLARHEGEALPTGRLVKFALWATPVIVLATTLALIATFAVKG